MVVLVKKWWKIFVDPFLGFKKGSSSEVSIWSHSSFLRRPKRPGSQGKKYHGVHCCCRLSVVVDMKCWNTPLTVSWQHSRRNDPLSIFFYLPLFSTNLIFIRKLLWSPYDQIPYPFEAFFKNEHYGKTIPKKVMTLHNLSKSAKESSLDEPWKLPSVASQ